jgi:hypothetical protein
VYNGVSYSFAGQIGVAPEWENSACGTACQELVTACMLAHVNATGQPRMRFRIVKSGGYSYSFKVQSTGKYVSLASSTLQTTNLPQVKQIAAGSSTGFQTWWVSPTGDGYFRICSDQTFHCISVGSTTSGSLVQGRPSTTTGPAMEWNILIAN